MYGSMSAIQGKLDRIISKSTGARARWRCSWLMVYPTSSPERDWSRWPLSQTGSASHRQNFQARRFATLQQRRYSIQTSL
ncbi:unnamed protein product [Penicillium salamii]|nr:unnamed protein product [Penicillium salamii]